MKLATRTVASRMVLLSLVQLGLMAIAALVIFSLGDHRHHGGHPGRGGDHHGPHPGALDLDDLGPLLMLAIGGLVLAGGSVVTARWIVRPIERLSAAASRLGEGDLGVRTGMDRPDEIGELGRRFDEMAERVERMLANERELLANVAHELRTPLSRIGVALDLAGEGDAARARASLGEIAVDLAELEVLVEDVLTIFRYDAGRGASMPLRREPTSPESLAAAAAERMRGRAPDRPLELAVEPGLPAVDVDPVLFRRVIANLLDNSHKYTPEVASPIRLSVRPAGAGVEFEVVDRGIGIHAEDLPNVYNPFFRGERSRARQTGGVGLGLTLAKRIIEAHGGTIEIASTQGVGTRARVVVPSASRTA